MKKYKNKNETGITRGSDNVFADLNLPEPGEVLTKARIAHEVRELIRREGLSQTAAASQLGVDQPKVSSFLMRGKLQGFSTDRLLRFLNVLGQDVDIVIHPAKAGRRAARVRIAVAA